MQNRDCIPTTTALAGSGDALDTMGLSPPIAAQIGPVEPIIRLPLWLTISLGLAAAIASTERALRLRYHWFLNAAGN